MPKGRLPKLNQDSGHEGLYSRMPGFMLGLNMNVVALKNLMVMNTSGKLVLGVPWGTKGKIIDRFEMYNQKYIRVRFDNGAEMMFGDGKHPLISYKNEIRIEEETNV